jgi:hypothetical protein
MARARLGVIEVTVAPAGPRRSRSRASGSRRTTSSANTSWLPETRQRKVSKLAASNCVDHVHSTRSVGPRSNSSAHHTTVLSRPRCGMRIPLGRPVVPEV